MLSSRQRKVRVGLDARWTGPSAVGIFQASWTRRRDSTKQTSGAGFSEAWIIEAKGEDESSSIQLRLKRVTVFPGHIFSSFRAVMSVTHEHSTNAVRDEVYYIDDGNVVLSAGQTLFKVRSILSTRRCC